MTPTKMYRAAVRLPWAKKRLEVGEQFEAPEDIGRILVLGRKAVEDVGETMVAPEVMSRASKTEPLAEEDAPTPKSVRTYQRRDMVAEQPKEDVHEEIEAAPKPRRGRPPGSGRRLES